MENIQELRDQVTFRVLQNDQIVEKARREDRALNPEEQEEIRGNQRENEAFEIKIKELERSEELAASVAEQRANLDKLRERRSVPIASTGNGGQAVLTSPRIEIPFRYGSTRAYPNTPEGYAEAHKHGMYLCAYLFKKPFAINWVRNNAPELRAMNEASNSAGGVFVPEEMSMRIIDLVEKYGVFRQHTYIEPMASDTKTVPREIGEMTAYWTAEGSAGTESDPAFDNITLTAKKLTARTRFSSELDEDSVVNVADMLSVKIARALAYAEDTAGFVGTGISTHGNITGVVTKLEADLTLKGAVPVATATHDLFSEIDAADLAALMGALPEYAAQNAKFFCSRPCAELVFGRLKATAGGNTVDTLEGRMQNSYLGYPIIVTQVMTKVLTALNDKVMLLFGDLSMASTMGVRKGIEISLTNDRYWEEDQIGIKGRERLDINVHDIGNTTDAGPIVGLIGSTS